MQNKLLQKGDNLMGIKKSVFCSKSESKNYLKLPRTWSDSYNTYPNLLFLNVFDLSNLLEFSPKCKIVNLILDSIIVGGLKR